MYNEAFMRRAIEISARALDEPGLEPFGAVVVRDGKIVGEGINRSLRNVDPTSHGETEAIRDACRNLSTADLSGCALYTSCDPCALCVAAMAIAGIAELFYAADPPILALGVENHADMRFKDTAANIRETEVFSVNIVSRAMAEAMHACAAKVPPEVDELAMAGLTARPGVAVASPWIEGAPAAFECRRHLSLALGRSREIILGRIVHAHFPAGAVDERLHVDPAAMDAIARLGGDPLRRPADEAVIQRLVRAVAGRRILSPAAGAQNMHDAADHAPVIEPWNAARVLRQKRSQAGHLVFGQPKAVRGHDISLPGD